MGSQDDEFQGVLYKHMSGDSRVTNILGLGKTSTHHGIECFNLELKNKYYNSTIHLIDFDLLEDTEHKQDILNSCHAIMLIANGYTLTTEQLESVFSSMPSQLEIRILICDNIDDDSECRKTLLDWSLQNKFDLLLSKEDDLKGETINSLSAYKWPHRSEAKQTDQQELSGHMLKKLIDFDSLLGKISAYRDQPELRGNPDDKNIEEIAEILSGLLGDDVDNFLKNEDDT